MRKIVKSGNAKGYCKMALCFSLVCTLLLTNVTTALSYEERKPVLLELYTESEVYSNGENQDESRVAMLSQNSSVEEEGLYTVTLGRFGNAARTETVTLVTVDISAKYGEDYKIEDNNYTTTVTPQEMTVLESRQVADEADEADEDSLNTVDELGSQQIQDDTLVWNLLKLDKDFFGFELAQGQPASGESSLAAKKKEQIEGDVRELNTSDASDYSLAENVINQLSLESGEQLPSTSQTEITFLPGETRKEITFKILSDNESEGDEVFDLTLTTKSNTIATLDPKNCKINIIDDEPNVDSIIEFSKNTYTNDESDEQIIIRIDRKDAVYKMVTGTLEVTDGTAVSGIDYANAQSIDFSFEPFVESVYVSIPVASYEEKSFSVNLGEIKGGVAGVAAQADVKIQPNLYENVTVLGEKVSAMPNASGTDTEKEFDLGFGSDNFVVRYIEGETTGKIIDTGISNNPQVGVYYFPMDKASGGTFLYGKYNGDETNKRSSEYVADSNGGYGYLKWKGKASWSKGGSALYSNSANQYLLNTLQYQYLKVQRKLSISGGNAEFLTRWYTRGVVNGIETDQALFDEEHLSNTKSIAKGWSEATSILNKNKLPQDVDLRLYTSIADDNHYWHTSEAYIYGVAAMYRKYNVTVEQPSSLTYRESNGEYVKKAPAIVELGNGHDIRYTGQTITIKETAPEVDAPIRGKITGYVLSVGSGKKTIKISVEDLKKYNEIPLTDDLIKKIQTITEKVEIYDDEGFVTKLRVKPVYEYSDTVVVANESAYGTYQGLEKGDNKFHIGDTISVTGVSKEGYENYIHTQTTLKTYKYKSDTKFTEKILRDGDTLTLDSQKYVLKPAFSNVPNYISIELTAAAKKAGLQVNNIVEKEDLEESEALSAALKDSEDIIRAVEVKTGKNYPIQVDFTKEPKDKNKMYKAVFTNDQLPYEVKGFVFDFLANPLPKENHIVIDVVEVNKKDNKVYRLEGEVRYDQEPVRSTGESLGTQAADNVTVIGGAYAATGMKENINRNRVTTENGSFSLTGVEGADGDCITLYMTDGSTDQVAYYTLCSGKLSPISASYIRASYDAEKNSLDYCTVDSNSVYKQKIAPSSMPIETAYTPSFEDFNYDVATTKANDINITDNQIEIVSGKITFSTRISLNKCTPKRLDYIIIRDDEEILLTSTNLKKEQTYIESGLIGLDSNFKPGDKLYVQLVSSEKEQVEFQEYDEQGNPVGEPTITEMEIKYPKRDTGISFYEPNTELKPQVYNIASNAEYTVPYIGSVKESVKSGKLYLQTKELETGVKNPAYQTTCGLSSTFTYPMLGPAERLQKVKANREAAAQTVDEQNKEHTPEKSANTVKDDVINDSTAAGADAKKTDVAKQNSENANKGSSVKTTPRVSFTVTTIFSMTYHYSEALEEYIMIESQFLLSGYFEMGAVVTGSIYGVPVYLNVSGNVGVQLESTIDNLSQSTEDAIKAIDVEEAENLADLIGQGATHQLGMGIKATAGVGFGGALSIHGTLGVDMLFRDEHDAKKKTDAEGVMLTFSGGVGVDLVFVSMDFIPTIAVVGTGLYKESSGLFPQFSHSGGLGELPTEIPTDPDGKDMTMTVNDITADSTADVKDFGQYGNLKKAASSSVAKSDVLLGDTVRYTRPQIGTFDNGKKIMLFTEKASNRDGTNVNALYYSVCEPNGAWSDPVVVDDDGTADTMPSLDIVGNNAVISWSDTGRVLTGEEDLKELISNLNIKSAVYNSETAEMSGAVTITNDEYTNINPQICFDEDNQQLVCYYMKNDFSTADDDYELISPSHTYSTMAYKAYALPEKGEETKSLKTVNKQKENLLEIKHSSLTDPLVSDFSVDTVKYEDDYYSIAAYTVDEDNDDSTAEDREIFLMITNLTKDIQYYPIQITNDYICDSQAKLERIDNSLIMMWTSGGSKIKTIDITYFIGKIFEDGLQQEFFKNPNDPAWYIHTAEDLGLSQEEYKDSVYEDFATYDLLTSEKAFTVSAGLPAMITDYKLVKGQDENYYILWRDSGDSSEDNLSTEIYGSSYLRPSDSQLQSGWADAVKLTELGLRIDEYDVTVNENGNLNLVLNAAKAKNNNYGILELSDRQLIETEVELTSSLGLSEDLELVNPIVAPGATTEVTATVLNNGLNASKGFKATLYETKDGEKIKEVQSIENGSLLYSGESYPLSFQWTAPNSIDGAGVLLELEQNGKVFSFTQEVSKNALFKITDSYVEYDKENKKAVLYGTASNLGNETIKDIKFAPAIYKDGSKKREIGVEKIDTLAPGESMKLAIPIDIKLKDFGQYGYVDILFYPTSGGEELDDNLVTLLESSPVGILINNKEPSEKITIKVGESLKLDTAIAPANVASDEVFIASENAEISTMESDDVLYGVSKGMTSLHIMHMESGITETVEVEVVGEKVPDTTQPTTNPGNSSVLDNTDTTTPSESSQKDTAVPSEAAATTGDDNGKISDKSVFTGYDKNLMYMVVLLVSAAVVIAIARKRRRKTL